MPSHQDHQRPNWDHLMQRFYCEDCPESSVQCHTCSKQAMSTVLDMNNNRYLYFCGQDGTCNSTLPDFLAALPFAGDVEEIDVPPEVLVCNETYYGIACQQPCKIPHRLRDSWTRGY